MSNASFDNKVVSKHDLLNKALLPEDSYLDGVYWADLPSRERSAWVNSQVSKETIRELRVVGRMVKEDPLSPISVYFSKYVTTGMGLFVEGYVLFSIGNLTPLFAAAWPACWKTHEVCNAQLINSVTYLEIVGIIIGQVVVGIEGDWIGRRFGLIQDAVIMFIGVVLLTAVWGIDLQGWVAAYTISLFVYGIGVGGEYPMTSTTALEVGIGGPAGTTEDRLHRGRRVVLAFLMQGWGQVFNQVVLILCLIIFNSGSSQGPYTPFLAQYTYRVSFGLIAILHLWLIYYRVYKLKFAGAKLQKDKARNNTSGYDIASLKLLKTHYWHRLVATSGGWFCNDFFFYGNKIFASTFIQVIKPGANLFTTWEFNLINIAVSLVGYYMAALLIDHKFYGRKTMQQVGFFFDFIFFLFGAIFFTQLQEAGVNIKVFQWMYYMSSFFNQFGPNCTTFLVAAEVFPISVRSTAHGTAAAIGKLGALAPTILYHYIDNQTKFYVVPWFGLLGALLTFFFLPDTTGLDLKEQERYWECVRSGQESSYHGIAIHPRHLSWYEIHVLKRNQHYDPTLDAEAKIAELRVLYESSLIAKEDVTGDLHDEDHMFVSDDVARYFECEEPREKSVQLQTEKRIELNPSEPTLNHNSLLSEIEKN